MPYIYKDTKTYNTYKEMWNLTRKELPYNCLYTSGLLMDEDANLYNMAERIENLHKSFGYEGDYGAYHIVVEYSSKMDLRRRSISDLIAVNTCLQKFFSDHPIAYGMFVNGEKAELHYILDPMNRETGEMLKLEDRDIIKFSCWCRRNFRDLHLKTWKLFGRNR